MNRTIRGYCDGDFIQWIVPEDVTKKMAITIRKDGAGMEFIGETPLDPRWLGMWFPVSCVMGNTKREVKTREEETTIIVKSLNEPIDPKLFKPSGRGVPEGTPVFGYSDEPGSHVWNGNEVVKSEPRKNKE